MILKTVLFFVLSINILFAQNTYYVSTTGNDANPGSLNEPWLTIQHAANTVVAGDIVYVRGGEYNETVTINVSGTTNNFITFQNYSGETPIIDGGGLSVPADDNGLFLIKNKNFIKIKGFELRNYKTSTKNIVPSAIFITGTSNNIEVRNCIIHNIEHNGQTQNGTDAHGIAIYGTSSTASINNVTIDGNELYDLILGSSEALVVNGNVEQFTISNNTVHDVNNIAIDCIGFEGTSPSVSTDQARNGNITDNLIYNVSSYGNPAYGLTYAAGGSYVDGGKDIIIDRNIVHNADIGIELASEHSGKSTSNITVRNNLIYENNIAGIAMGGYDTNRGSTENCTVVNNTLYNNDTKSDGNGELWLQYDVKDSEIKNNIVYAGQEAIFITNYYTQNTNNTVNFNLYYSTKGENDGLWVWKTNEYYEFSSYRNGTGNDANGLFANPQFIDINNKDFHLQNNSPAINIGDNTVSAGNYDLDNKTRIENSTIDLGSYEYRNSVLLDVKIFFEGSYDKTTHSMTTGINNVIPKTSPYTEDQRSIDNVPANIVDWILVELRETADGNAISSRSSLLRNDGFIVSDDGNSTTISLDVNDGNYFIVLKHRNHLSVMSKNSIGLNSTSTTLYDFTTDSNKFYGNNGAKNLEP